MQRYPLECIHIYTYMYVYPGFLPSAPISIENHFNWKIIPFIHRLPTMWKRLANNIKFRGGAGHLYFCGERTLVANVPDKKRKIYTSPKFALVTAISFDKRHQTGGSPPRFSIHRAGTINNKLNKNVSQLRHNSHTAFIKYYSPVKGEAGGGEGM